MKKSLKLILAIALVFIVYFGFSTYKKLDLITGFSAKSTASCYFLDQRSLKSIAAEDNNIDMVNLAENSIETKKNMGFSTIFGLKKRKAIYREGLGATLISADFDEAKPYLVPKRTKFSPNLPFPYGHLEPNDTIFENVNYQKIKQAIAIAFQNNSNDNKKSRSILVVYKDNIIAEKYADGFDKNSLILGWSMTKSITGTYFGILQKEGKLNINQTAPIAEWKNDARKEITIHNLLQMNSGLAWEEDYTKISDVTQMLFQAKDMTNVQQKNPLVGKPNNHWIYSSGTTNLLSGILRKQFANHQAYLDFWYNSLIDKIGMTSAILETDMSGNYVGSSYCWATTRDWAKFGLLYLHRGQWNGEQIFDPSWAKYVSTPTPTSKGQYGAQFWLNAGGKFPNAPKDMFYASGYQGQKVAIFPSDDLVIVRMGLSEDFDFDTLYKDVLGSISKPLKSNNK
jgi:CubicO group peptidase (beta-lactamase class C family)